MEKTTTSIKHDPNKRRFFVDGAEEARVSYEFVQDNVMDIVSTYVPETMRGTGYARELVQYALDYAQRKHYGVIPSCSYVRKVVARNSDYKKLIVSGE